MEKGIHGLVIVDKKILSVNTYGFDIFPGGKLNNGENDVMGLKREFKEELSGMEILVGSFYKIFHGINPRNGEQYISKTYFCYPLGEIGNPSSEIQGVNFIDSSYKNKLNFSETSSKTFESLIKDELID